MHIIRKILLPSLAALFLFSLTQCEKGDTDIPPISSISDDSIVTIGMLRDMIVPGEVHRFRESGKHLFGVVTMDEHNGNIHRQVFLEDSTGGINLRTHISADIREGDSIRLSLDGAVLNYFRNLLQLDSVNGPARIVIQERNRHRTPVLTTIEEILEGGLQSRLVMLDSVQFAPEELNQTWADGFNLESLNRDLQDCSRNTIIVRSSGYADFANDTLPAGRGRFVGIVTQFFDTWQLFVRDPAELDMTHERCVLGELGVTVFQESFTSNLGDFTDFNILGNQNWIHQTFDGGTATMNGFAGGQANANENWLVSPQIDLSNYNNVRMQIREAINFMTSPNGYNDLKVLVASDYDGTSDPNSSGTWVHFSDFARPPGSNWTYVESGDIDISQFDGESIHIALHYTSTSSHATAWQVSRITVIGDE